MFYSFKQYCTVEIEIKEKNLKIHNIGSYNIAFTPNIGV